MKASDGVQPTLDQPEWFVPMPHGSGHYVPVVQNRSGELAALAHASPATWARMTPLVELVGPRKQSDAYRHDTVKGWVKRTADSVGEHPFFLDILRMRPAHPTATAGGPCPVLAVIYEAARKRRLRFVPVLRLSDPHSQTQLLRDAALIDGRGVALRYPLLTAALPEGQTLESLVKESLRAVEVEVTGADLLVDLSYLPPEQDILAEDLMSALDELAAFGNWRSFALLGTSIPSMLGGVITQGTVGEIPRREWELWSALKQHRPRRMPSFGDYVIQHPNPPQDGGGPSMRANIRYTTRNATVVARGRGPVVTEGREQYRELCQQLVDRPEFVGCDYSWGDEQIADCANGTMEPGANNAWRGAGSSHHLRWVADQLTP
jgi:Beta protein